MSAFLEYGDFCGGEDAGRLSRAVRDFFELAADLRGRLGRKGYLIDNHLCILLGAVAANPVFSVVERGFNNAGTELREVIRSVMQDEKEEREHPLYKKAKAWRAKTEGAAPPLLTLRLSSCFLFCASIRHYFPKRAPCKQGRGQRHKPRLASPRHGNFTPPRIAPSRPHCVIPLARGCGWTDVLYRRCLGETARHGLLSGRMGDALHLVWPSFTEGSLRRWSWRILRCRLSLPGHAG